jgi:hypothetical protein
MIRIPSKARECRRCEEEFMPAHSRIWYCSDWCKFMSKVRKDDECWEWTDSLATYGYGYLTIATGEQVRAHRWAYENLGRGTLIEGMVIDHLCRNKACVNPKHLEQVTYWENTRRGVAPNIQTHVTGICKRGHAIKDENILINSDGRRRCKTCNRATARAYAARKTSENKS